MYRVYTKPNGSRPLFNGLFFLFSFFYLCNKIRYWHSMESYISDASSNVLYTCMHQIQFLFGYKREGYLIQSKCCCGHSEWCDSKRSSYALSCREWELVSCWKKHCGCGSLWGKHFWLRLTASCPIKPRELDQMWLRTVETINKSSTLC